MINLTKPIESSFFSCEKDTELILEKLFIQNRQKGNELKRLLVINTPDCLDTTNIKYQQIVESKSIKDLKNEQYIKITPKIAFKEHEEVKSYILISFDNFIPNATNPQFRDCTVSFDIICHTDYWDLGGFQLRPLKIAGYIDGLLNNCRLTGIGTFQFLGCSELILDENLAGYTLMYSAVHGSDDRIDNNDDD